MAEVRCDVHVVKLKVGQIPLVVLVGAETESSTDHTSETNHYSCIYFLKTQSVEVVTRIEVSGSVVLTLRMGIRYVDARFTALKFSYHMRTCSHSFHF